MQTYEEIKNDLKNVGQTVYVQLNPQSMFSELGGFIPQDKIDSKLLHGAREVSLYPKYGILAELQPQEGEKFFRAFAFDEAELKKIIRTHRLSYTVIKIVSGYVFESRYWRP